MHMQSYQVYENLAGHLDAYIIHHAVTASTRDDRDESVSCLDDVERQLDYHFFGRHVTGVSELTHEVLKAIRSVAVSYQYDIRSEEWRLRYVGQLIKEVDEALEAIADREAEKKAHDLFVKLYVARELGY